MSVLVECSSRYDLGAHGHMFYSALHLKPWYKLSMGAIEGVVNTLFEVLEKAVHYVRASDIYHTDQQKKHLQQLSVWRMQDPILAYGATRP